MPAEHPQPPVPPGDDRAGRHCSQLRQSPVTLRRLAAGTTRLSSPAKRLGGAALGRTPRRGQERAGWVDSLPWEAQVSAPCRPLALSPGQDPNVGVDTAMSWLSCLTKYYSFISFSPPLKNIKPF